MLVTFSSHQCFRRLAQAHSHMPMQLEWNRCDQFEYRYMYFAYIQRSKVCQPSPVIPSIPRVAAMLVAFARRECRLQQI